VAYVCQQHVEASPETIVWEFFNTFAEWQWPQPVMLNRSVDGWILILECGQNIKKQFFQLKMIDSN